MKLHPSARQLIESGVLAHLVTLDRDGKPQVTCAWVGYDDDHIVMATLFDQRKLWNMRRDPRVGLSFESDVVNRYGLKEYLVVDGLARVTEGGAAGLLQRLAHVYLGPEVVFPEMEDPPPGFITHISIERVSGVGPWAGPDET